MTSNKLAECSDRGSYSDSRLRDKNGEIKSCERSHKTNGYILENQRVGNKLNVVIQESQRAQIPLHSGTNQCRDPHDH